MGRLTTKEVNVGKSLSSSIQEKKKNKAKIKKKYQNKFNVGNASQGHGFAIVKKKQFLSKFRRKNKKRKEKEQNEFIHIKPLADDSINSTSTSNSNISTFSRKSKKRNSANLQKIEIDYHAIQKERLVKAEELKRERAEHEEKVRKNIEKRKKITKKLSKKTKRGQPVMADRLELMLSKLKNS